MREGDITLINLLRSMATGTDYRERKHDIILIEAANAIEYLRAAYTALQNAAQETGVRDGNELQRLRAGRAAVWAECRETCAKVADDNAAGACMAGAWQADKLYRAIAKDIRALEVPNE